MSLDRTEDFKLMSDAALEALAVEREQLAMLFLIFTGRIATEQILDTIHDCDTIDARRNYGKKD